jgi:hypothetical protein
VVAKETLKGGMVDEGEPGEGGMSRREERDIECR